jgi:hypothetical protein
MDEDVLAQKVAANENAVNVLCKQIKDANLTEENLQTLTQTLRDKLDEMKGGRRRSAKKRSTQRKQKRRQRRGSRRAY